MCVGCFMTWWVTRKKLTRKKGGPYYSGISGTNILNYSLAAMSSPSGGDAAVAALVGGMALLVYASTRAMRVLGGDTGELMAMSCQRGVAHPPGYPLLTMLGSRCVSPKRVLFALPGPGRPRV